MSALLYRAGDSADIERICRRLKMSKAEIARIMDVLSAQEFFAEPEAISKSARTRLAGKSYIGEHLEFCRARLKAMGQDTGLFTRWRKELASLRQNPPPSPLIDGNDLIALGCKPGPAFRKILRAIEDMQYEGLLTSRPEALRYIQKSFVNTYTP